MNKFTEIKKMLKIICFLILIFLPGCSSLPIPCPFPIRSYAPKTPYLPEDKEESAMEQVMATSPAKRENVLLAMRGGHLRGISIKTKDSERQDDTLNPKRKFGVAAYEPPPKYTLQKEGNKHYFHFTVTKDFASANNNFLSGNGEEALKIIDKMLSSPDNTSALYWQASALRVSTLVMMGKFQLAEEEIRRADELEMASLQQNVGSRALRSEVRYWAGDLAGAKADAIQVLKAIGNWRFPTHYPSPPIDQTRLADTTLAQVRAAIVLGLIYFSEENYEEASPWLEMADQTMNNVVWVSNHAVYGFYFPIFQEVFYGRGLASVALGSILLVRDPDSQQAQKFFERGKEYFDAIGYTLGRILIHNFKAFAFYKAGRFQKAIDEATEGLKISGDAELLDYVWRLETLRGQCFLKLNQFKHAEEAMRHAQTVVDLMVGTMVTDDAKVRFGFGKETITKTLVEIDLRNNDFGSLFQDLERGRARAFVSMLANKITITNREEDLVKQIRKLDDEILKIRQKKYAISGKQFEGEKKETDLLKNRQVLLSRLRRRDEELADILSVSTVSLQDLQRKLKSNEVIFYSLPLEPKRNIALLVINRTSAKIKELKANASQLHNYLEAMIFSIMRGSSVSSVENSSLAALRGLFAFLSEEKYASAYVVPSQDLFFIPWGALDINYPISVIPTASWIVRSHVAISDERRFIAAVVGDPNFGGIFPQLAGAREEACAVAKNYNVSPLIGSVATEEALREKVKDGIGIIHLATHALFDQAYPLQSALILTDSEQAKPLTAQRLFEQPLKTNIVILSACETGLGQVVSGDDLLGLNRSFYLGGATTILSSLWPVADEPTRIFMECFHQNIKDGDYGKAWLKARNALREKKFSASVYGSFNINGLLSSEAL